MYGAHLKAPSAMVRMRLYGVLTLLPPGTYEGSYINRNPKHPVCFYPDEFQPSVNTVLAVRNNINFIKYIRKNF